MKSTIGLDEIRKTIAAIKRRKDCRATDVTAEDVRTELKFTGSNSTSGPMIRAMLDEAVLAENLDYENISAQLKSAFLVELRRVAFNASADLRRQLEAGARQNDDLRNQNAAISKELAELQTEMAKFRADAAEKITVLETEMAEARGKISVFDEIRNGLSTQLKETKEDLADRRHEITKIENDLRSAREKEGELNGKAEGLAAKVTEMETARLLCEKERAVSESKVSSLEERVSELKSENQRLIGENNNMATNIGLLQDKLQKAGEEKAAAVARLDEVLKSKKKKGAPE